jgi:SAM-dependent methyltransferase
MNVKRWVSPLLMAALFAAPAAALAEIEQELDIYFVPTPEVVVDEMLRMAEVGEGDRVYDLGCGDGRIVITAADRYGTTGIGVDLDPARIAESVANAREAGVEDKVRFVEGNLFDIDLSGASVVTLYLLTSINERLRPKLLRELRPGTRVVSHAFGMGPWRPDRQSRVDGAKVFMWVVPAAVAGRWEGEVQRSEGDAPISLLLEQAFQDMTGMAVLGSGHMALDAPRLEGDRIEFSVASADGTPLRFTGRVAGETMEGSLLAGEAGEAVGSWRAVRVSSAADEPMTLTRSGE